MGLLRMRLEIYCRRRRKAAEEGGGMGASWCSGAWGARWSEGCDGGGTCTSRFPLPFAMPTLIAASVSGSTPAAQGGDPL